MEQALDAYLKHVAKTGDHAGAVVAGAEAVANRPWAVVHAGGLLARCQLGEAPRRLGLRANLTITTPTSSAAVAVVEQGQPYPALDHRGRRSRGAFDTPVEMARRVANQAFASVEGPLRRGLDPACGSGAFLLAMKEAGVPEILGTDIDPVVLSVARIAVPEAQLEERSALSHGPSVDLVAGNPPFVPPERQDKDFRKALRRRYPWLKGRFDLVIPFAAAATDRVRAGGAIGLVLPRAAMVQPYGAVLRRRWVERHAIRDLSGPHPFPGASVDVMLVVLQKGAGPAPLPAFDLPAEELLRLDNVPFNPDLMPGDVGMIERIRQKSIPLADLCLVDTGVVAHGPGRSKQELLYDEPGEGRVPFADARDFFAGKHRWLHYAPKRMHRAKKPSMFEGPKIVVQRIRGKGKVRAAIDREGIYVGHTCTVVQRKAEEAPPLEVLVGLIRSPLVDGITRIERGQRLDLYPRDVGRFPVPETWLKDPSQPLEEAWALDDDEVARLRRFAGLL